MGKKTDKFMLDISNELDTLNAAVSRYVAKAAELKASTEMLAKVTLATDQAQAKVMAKFGLRLEDDFVDGVDDAIVKDPLYNKCVKLFNDEGIKKDKIGRELRAIANSISDIRVDLRMHIDDFEAFVTKKKKSKNPFTGKKSVPAAENFIQNANNLYKKLQA